MVWLKKATENVAMFLATLCGLVRLQLCNIISPQICRYGLATLSVSLKTTFMLYNITTIGVAMFWQHFLCPLKQHKCCKKNNNKCSYILATLLCLLKLQ